MKFLSQTHQERLSQLSQDISEILQDITITVELIVQQGYRLRCLKNDIVSLAESSEPWTEK